MRLSIITINLNNCEGLSRTIESVARQMFRDFEFIIIDGNSNDGSQDVIKKNQEHIAAWLSEKDSGIYDAMNKGILLATGEYFLFLNSGDTLVSEVTLKNVAPFLGKHDIIYGNLKINDNGKITDGFVPDTLTLEHMVKDTLWHPVSFIRKQLFDKCGGYATSYRLCGDYDFFFRSIVIDKVSYCHIPEFISEFNLQGLSSQFVNTRLIKKEKLVIQLSYLTMAELGPFLEEQPNKGFLKRLKRWFQ